MMFNQVKPLTTALFMCAVSLCLAHAHAQVPVIDATQPLVDSTPQEPSSGGVSNAVTSQGELFYQLQLLQEEVRMLRGLVEEQGYQLRQLKEQSMQRYIDLDRRIGAAASIEAASGSSGESTSTPAPTVVPAVGEKAAYDAAYRLVVAKQFADALSAFKAFLTSYPDGKYTPNSYYWQGELYQVIDPQDLEASRQAFTQLLDLYPRHAKAPDAMYKLGRVYYQKGNKAKAREWLSRVIKEYANSANPAVDKARQFLSQNL